MADEAEAVCGNALYEADFYEGTQEQARLLRERRQRDGNRLHAVPDDLSFHRRTGP